MADGACGQGLAGLLLSPCNEPAAQARGGVRWFHNPYLIFAVRLVLAAVFIYAALQKIGKPLQFAEEIRMYRVLDIGPLLYITAIVLPWVELLCGIFLIPGLFIRGSALILVILSVFFLVFVSIRTIGVLRNEETPFMRIYFDCGCGFGVTYAWKKLLENVLLLAGSVLLLTAPVHRFALDLSRRRS